MVGTFTCSRALCIYDSHVATINRMCSAGLTLLPFASIDIFLSYKSIFLSYKSIFLVYKLIFVSCKSILISCKSSYKPSHKSKNPLQTLRHFCELKADLPYVTR